MTVIWRRISGNTQKHIRFDLAALFVITVLLVFSGCPKPSGDYVPLVLVIESSNFANPGSIKELGTVTLKESGKSFKMIYAQDQDSVTFPFRIDDSEEKTVTEKFWAGETEVTNEIFAEVYQWAYDNGKFNTTDNTTHNYLSADTVKYGGKELIDLDGDEASESICQINYSNGKFSVDSGFEQYPVVSISWYGAVMFCNWLTEMRDANTDNVVYSGITSNWSYDKTSADTDKTGYRLPSEYEWVYTARYRGDDSTNVVTASPWDTSFPKWTKGNSASGATADYNDATATEAVAWIYNNSKKTPHSNMYKAGDIWRGTHPVGTAGNADGGGTPRTGFKNTLGLYDMSGSVGEWCFTNKAYKDDQTYNEILKGGDWKSANNVFALIEYEPAFISMTIKTPESVSYRYGFRIYRSR